VWVNAGTHLLQDAETQEDTTIVINLLLYEMVLHSCLSLYLLFLFLWFSVKLLIGSFVIPSFIFLLFSHYVIIDFTSLYEHYHQKITACIRPNMNQW